jgi:hypothetical protein
MGSRVTLLRTMFDWHKRSYRGGEEQGRPSTFTSAGEALEAGNAELSSHGADEVLVYHRLYSDQACLRFSIAIPKAEVAQKAAHLEKQAQRASRTG